jgi:hypothetical protein
MSSEQRPIIDLRDIEYNTLREKVREKIAEFTPYWKDFHDMDPGIVILDLASAITDMMMYYLDKRVNELIISRAQSKQSIIDLGKVFDYRLRRSVAATADIVIKPTAEYPNEGITLPAFTGITTTEGFPIYYTKTPYILPATNSSEYSDFANNGITVSAYEGSLVIEGRSPNLIELSGGTTQRYKLKARNIADNFIFVLLNGDFGEGELWQEAEFAPPIEPASTAEDAEKALNRYIIEVDDTGAYLVFNGFRYNSPSSGNAFVYYLATSGLSGLVKKNRLTEIVSVLDNALDVATLQSQLTLTNSVDAYGATEEEDYTKIKEKLPSYLCTQWRAVTLHDFAAVAKLFPGVKSAKATLTSSFNVSRIVNIFVLSESYILNEESFCAEVLEFVNKFAILGVEVVASPAVACNTHITLTVEIDPYKSSSAAYTEIMDTLTLAYQKGTRELGQSILLDDVYALVKSLPYVRSCQISELYKEGESASCNHIRVGSYEYGTLNSIVLNISPWSGV